VYVNYGVTDPERLVCSLMSTVVLVSYSRWHFLSLGLSPNSVAYIKPVTQCEAEQAVTQYCTRMGVEHVSIGPVVFYKGFTRSFLAGETDGPNELLRQVKEAVAKIGRGKKFVLVDGVGRLTRVKCFVLY
jgi:hypothetical protein